MLVRELLAALKDVDLNAEVVIWADHNGHWFAHDASTAHLRSDEDDYEVDLWHPNDLKEFLEECEESGETYEPKQVFVIDGVG